VNCYACGREASLEIGGRVGFRDECEDCGAALHACRNCARYDRDAYNECREPNAERVSGRDRANRCEYFTPGGGEGGGPAQEQQRARSQLDTLFKKT